MPRDEESATDYHLQWVDGAESLDKYRPGGYHPVMVGDVLHGRYRIVDKLGFGGYSTVGVADAILQETDVLRALSAPRSPSGFTHPGRDSIPYPLDEFQLTGPNGTHPCYTMALAQCNLREVSFSRLFPLEVARALSGGLALSIAYMHSQGYAHGDIHLRNVLVKPSSSLNHLSVGQFYEEYGKPETVPITRTDEKQLPLNVPRDAVIPLNFGKNARDFSLEDARVLLSDFGEAFCPDLKNRLGKDCHTPLPMRPPEARFQPNQPLLYSADIWILAVAIWEILGMKAIFSSEFVTADDVVSQQVDVLGPMPSDWWESWAERREFFDENGRPTGERDVWPPIAEAFEEGVQKYRKKLRSGEFDRDETAAILHLMRRMLAFRPEDRPTAEEVLQSEWMVKWVLPDFERTLEMN